MSQRVVFDCMVYLQAVVNPSGQAFACFRQIEEGAATLVVSPAVLAEVRDVLTRPRLQAKFRSLTAERVDQFLQLVEAKAQLLTAVPVLFPYPRDPKDEPYINLALTADASYLVSRDKDLLDLMKVADFRSQFPKLHILDPVDFLHKLTTSGSKLEEGTPPACGSAGSSQ